MRASARFFSPTPWGLCGTPAFLAYSISSAALRPLKGPSPAARHLRWRRSPGAPSGPGTAEGGPAGEGGRADPSLEPRASAVGTVGPGGGGAGGAGRRVPRACHLPAALVVAGPGPVRAASAWPVPAGLSARRHTRPFLPFCLLIPGSDFSPSFVYRGQIALVPPHPPFYEAFFLVSLTGVWWVVLG